MKKKNIYSTLRTIHLLFGMFALPMLLMYGVSSVQMGHTKWFPMKPATSLRELQVQPGLKDTRVVARLLMDQRVVRGEIGTMETREKGFNFRVTVPGIVHEIDYSMETGGVRVKTHRAGFLGMLNRMHHAAGVRRDFGPLRIWGWLAGLVSFATAGLGLTGLWMWWVRRQERRAGLVLLGANLAFTITILFLLRAQGL